MFTPADGDEVDANDESKRHWSIQDVTRMTGITSRTLRHYDAIGLLKPSRISVAGTRSYRMVELRRLQQILVMRELGLSLERISKVLDDQIDELTALRERRAELAAEGTRLRVIQASVQRAINALEHNRALHAEDLFEGFEATQQVRYEVELVEAFGTAATLEIDRSWQRIAEMDARDGQAVSAGFSAVEHSLAAKLKDSVPVEDASVQELVAQHYAIVCRFWAPTPEAYVGLGQMYLDHPDFRARFDAVHPGLAEYLAEAMTHYAIANTQ